MVPRGRTLYTLIGFMRRFHAKVPCEWTEVEECFCLLIFRSHLAFLRVCTWLCDEGSALVVRGGTICNAKV